VSPKQSLPWLKFYPSDWLSDAVAGCSLAAQGLWLRLLIVTHSSQRYGCAEVDGKPIPDELLARRCGCDPEEFRGLLAELYSAGVPGRLANGSICSRRMIRDQEDRDAAADRQRRHRHAPVTPKSQGEVRSQKSEARGQIKVKTRTQNPRATQTNYAHRSKIENRNRRMVRELEVAKEIACGSEPTLPRSLREAHPDLQAQIVELAKVRKM